MDVFAPILSIVASTLCSLNIGSNCALPNVITLYQWTSNGRIELPENQFNTLHPLSHTYAIIHGWTENSFEPLYEKMARNYLTKDPSANIIIVSYEQIASAGYLMAHEMVDTAGKLIAERLVDYINAGYMSPYNMHLIGHSLGSHVAGKVARLVRGAVGMSIARISALDPAGPLFDTGVADDSLKAADADFVDVTHTSGTAGIATPIGTVDTYFGLIGLHQPACNSPPYTVPSEIAAYLEFCDHHMSVEYWVEAILSCGFKMVKIGVDGLLDGETIPYGEHIPLTASGAYIVLNVNAASPYAQGDPTCNPIS